PAARPGVRARRGEVEVVQEERGAEGDEPVESSEGPIRHQQIHPWIQTKAAAPQVTGGDLVGRRHLEGEWLGSEATGARRDVEQDVGEVGRIEGGDRSAATFPHEGETDRLPVPPVEVALPVLREPTELIIPTGVLEDPPVDLAKRVPGHLRSEVDSICRP